MFGSLFNGLYPAERVLMVLGILLFFVLVFAFLFLLLKGNSVVPVLAAFLLPIAMIGYSRLQSISFGKDVGTIQFYTEQLQKNPTDPALRSQLNAALSSVQSRADNSTSAESAATVATGQFAAGDTDKATQTLQKATTLNPQAPAVLQLEHKIDTFNRLTVLTQQVKAQPADTTAKVQLAKVVASASQFSLANPTAIAQLASAQAVVGDREQAAMNARKALAIQPKQAIALQVDRSLTRQGTF